jgi:hypothetical protein
MGAHIEIRPLSAADALACDAIVASLAYRFANEEGRAEAAAGGSGAGPSTGRSASSWPGTCRGCGPATPP